MSRGFSCEHCGHHEDEAPRACDKCGAAMCFECTEEHDANGTCPDNPATTDAPPRAEGGEPMSKEREQRISRLCRMAGNIAAGIAIYEDYDADCDGNRRVTRYVDSPENIAAAAVRIALAIDAEVQRACPEEP